jgi:hypothetical protein
MSYEIKIEDEAFQKSAIMRPVEDARQDTRE